jgi:hypothetical protein
MPRQKRRHPLQESKHPRPPVRVPILDDSVIVRKLLCEALATSAAATVVHNAANNLNGQAQTLRDLVTKFLAEVRSA